MTKPRDLATLGGGFTQSGTGAIQRTVENKLKDTVSVKDFGAVGDGVADDTAAVDAANVWLSGSTLLAPKHLVIDCPVRYTGKVKLGAITLTDVSGFTIEWKNGGRLLMDNLTATLGTNNGLWISGTASNVTLINPFIEWVTAASTRSTGDGITFKGYPSDALCLNNIRIIGQSYIKNAPQTGAIFYGCKNVYVDSHHADTTLADGLHFNACQNVVVNSARATNNGDDALALVTYYNPSSIEGGGASWKTSRTPYAQPTLGSWNNLNTTVGIVNAAGGTATGTRIAGAKGVSIGTVNAQGKDFGLQVDAGQVGGVYVWTYLASKQIQINQINARQCGVGLFVRAFNSAITETSYTDFDVQIGNVKAFESTQYGVSLEVVKGISIAEIEEENSGSSGTLLNIVQDVSIEKIRSKKTSGLGLSMSGLCKDVTFTVIELDVSSLYIVSGNPDARMQRIHAQTIISRNAASFACYIEDVVGLTIDTLRVYNPNTGNSASVNDMRALLTNRVENVFIGTFIADVLVSNYRTWEMGGGFDASHIAGNDVTIGSIRWRVPAASDGIVFQGGPFGYAKIAYSGKWQDTATTTWTALTADTY